MGLFSASTGAKRTCINARPLLIIAAALPSTLSLVALAADADFEAANVVSSTTKNYTRRPLLAEVGKNAVF